MSTKIMFNHEEKSIHIDDEAKTMHYFFCFFVTFQLLINSLQLYNNWGKFDSWLFYIYVLLFIAFIGFGIFYFFYDNYEKEIALTDIKYYGEMPFLWTKLRYFKLKNNKVRLINFGKRSKASESLIKYLNKHQVSIKS